MMNKMKTLIVIVVITFFSGCYSSQVEESKYVNQSRIFQRYDIVYNASAKSYRAEAIFRFGGKKGTTLKLSNPSNVTINGENLDITSKFFGGVEYALAKNKQLIPGAYTFVFEDFDGKSYSNSYYLNTFEKVNIPTKIRRGEDLPISWTHKVKGDEIVSISIYEKTSIKEDINVENYVEQNPIEDIASIYKGVNKEGQDRVVISAKEFASFEKDTLYVKMSRGFSDLKIKETGDVGGSFYYRCDVDNQMVIFEYGY